MNDNIDLKLDPESGRSDAPDFPHKPGNLSEKSLCALNHAEWLRDFSKVLALNTGVQMSPGRQGIITRLYWAHQYVKLMQRRLEEKDKLIQQRVETVRRLERELGEALTRLGEGIKS